jgi:hypothetical protein
MEGGFGRFAVRLGTVLLLLIFCHIGQLRAEEMSATGVVLESGASGVILPAPGKSAGVKYNTGRETRYSPEDYRPVKGDTIKVEYYRKLLKNGEEILAVSALSLVKQDPNRKEITSPAEGVVSEIGRKNIRFHFPNTGQQVSMERQRGMELVPGGWEPAEGNKVRVHYNKVRAKFGSGFVYVITRIEKLD